MEAWLIRLKLSQSSKTGIKHNKDNVTNIKKSSFVQRRNWGNERPNSFFFFFNSLCFIYLFTLALASFFIYLGNTVLFMILNIMWPHNRGNGPRNFDIPPLNNWLEGREDSSFCHYCPYCPYFRKICLYYLWKNLLMAIGRSDKKKTSHSFLDGEWRYWRMDLGLGSLEQWQTDLSRWGWQ